MSISRWPRQRHLNETHPGKWNWCEKIHFSFVEIRFCQLYFLACPRENIHLFSPPRSCCDKIYGLVINFEEFCFLLLPFLFPFNLLNGIDRMYKASQLAFLSALLYRIRGGGRSVIRKWAGQMSKFCHVSQRNSLVNLRVWIIDVLLRKEKSWDSS